MAQCKRGTELARMVLCESYGVPGSDLVCGAMGCAVLTQLFAAKEHARRAFGNSNFNARCPPPPKLGDARY
eukprot:1832834-Rhodomonas_salina.1